MATTRSTMPRRLLMIFGGIALIFLVLHITGVMLLRYFVEKELHPALPRGTYIGKVNLNLFSGSLEIENFQLNRDGVLRLRVSRLVLGVAPWRLVTGEVHVREASLHQGYVRIERGEDGSIDFGLPEFGGDEPQPDEPAAALPRISIAGAVIDRLVIDYHDGDVNTRLYAGKLAAGAFTLGEATQEIPVEWNLQWDNRAISGDAVVKLDGEKLGVTGTLHTDPLDLGLAERLARMPKSIGGEIAYNGSFEWSGDTLLTEGDLKISELQYSIAERKVELTGIHLPGSRLKLVTAPKLKVEYLARAGSTAATWATQLGGQSVSGRRLALEGALSYDDGGFVDVAGLDLSAELIAWSDAGRRLQLDNVSINGSAQYSLAGDTPFPALNAQVGIDQLSYTDDGASLSAQVNSLRFKDLVISQLDDNRKRQLSGQLTLAASEVRQGDTGLGWSTFEAGLGGHVGKDVLDIYTNNRISGLAVSNPLLEHGPLRLEEVVTTNLKVGDEVAFESLRIAQINLPGDPLETSLRIGSIEVAATRYSAQQGADVGQVRIDALETAVIRDKASQWRYPMSPSGGPGSASTSSTGTSGAGSSTGGDSMAWRLAGLSIGGESYLTVADQMNPDMVAPKFKIEKLQVGTLASGAPDTITPFDVVLRPDTYSEFVISGETRPLAAQPYLKATGHLHGFPMKGFNGLIANDLGHRFLNGQLDNDFEILIENNKLDMKNALALATVEAEEIEGKEGPPIATAIALLEDRDGNIKLEVPVSGDLNDPNFKVLGALNPIIFKAVAGTAALAIQPLGSVLLVGSLLADQALKVTFDPAPFDVGSTALNADASKYLGELAGKLKEKPKLRVRVCGVAVDAERKKDKEGKYLDTEDAMLALAQTRADAAKAQLVKAGADAKQLRTCRPALDAAADAQPRVDIKF